MMRLVKAGDHQTFDAYAKSLELPNASDWYKSVFGDKFGEQVSIITDRSRSEFALSSWDMMQNLLSQHQAEIGAVRFDKSCNDRATPVAYPILIERTRNEPFFDVRFSGNGSTSAWTYFAYVDGAFRYIGNFRWGDNFKIGREANLGRPQLTVGGNVMRASLIHMVQPEYPSIARQMGIQGNEVFHAIIGTDGAVKDLVLVEGVCALADPARQALQQWPYKPTMLNGKPVEVNTTLTVVFTLGQ
ncbi:MAG TPA: energy transducer TonB [Candidatus Acidoferrales bacterium]|nr:energy transducer TonB [Candidatus Acidoferrales bacterium]